MAVAFTRALGYESGVQLNPLRDNSEIPAQDNADQIFGIVMRATRGRIDRPFVVSSGDVYTKLGYGEPIRVNALNEAWVHVVEALNNGAYQAVVQRLVTDEAKIKYAVCRADETNLIHTFEVSEEKPTGEFLLSVKHLECFNDGIKLAIHAEEVEGDESDGQDYITLRILDKDDNQLYEFSGSLNPDSKDDYGNSDYLPDVVSGQTDALEVTIGVEGDKAVIAAGSDAYGWESGEQVWAESDTLICFTEGATTYTTTDYEKARKLLQNAPFDFSYISSGGSRATPLLQQLAKLAYATNRQLRFDIPGELTPEAAIAFQKNLNFEGADGAHLLQAFWAPLKTEDPTGVNPKGYFGCATLNIALACARNATTDSNGFAAKNYVIAGREHPINRSGITQTYIFVDADKEKSALAKAKINPVIFESYTGGGRYVFFDSLTCAPVTNSLRKLIAVVDMSTSVDDAITRTAKDYLQLPMSVAVEKMKAFLRDYFANAQAAGWLVASSDPMMGGAAYKYQVAPNAAHPYDRMDVEFWVRYDGTARQIHVTQTITK